MRTRTRPTKSVTRLHGELALRAFHWLVRSMKLCRLLRAAAKNALPPRRAREDGIQLLALILLMFDYLCPAPLALALPRRSRLASRSISRAAPLPLDSLGSALHPRRSMAAATRPSSSNSLHSARRPSAASALSPVGAVGTRGWSSRIAAGTAVGRQAVLWQAGAGEEGGTTGGRERGRRIS